MNNKNNAKKLTLNKETIRNLSDDKLGQVAGGAGDSAGLICVFSVIGVCGDSVACSVLANVCTSNNKG